VVGDRMSDNLTEKLRDLFSRLVDRRRDEMRRALSRELDDPLAEISLDRVDPLRLEVIGQADLLRRHRLRLDHELRFLRATERGAQSIGPERAFKAPFEFGLGCGQSGPQPPPLDRSAVEASPPRNARRTTRAAPVPCARRVTRTIPKLTS